MIHPTADVSPRAHIGEDTAIWHHAQVREGASLGRGCIVGKGAYIDADVEIGEYCKIQNYVSIFHGVTLEDGVFCGPHCVFTNDKRPRAVNPDGSRKSGYDWQISPTHVGRGAAIGANATVLCGLSIGRWAMIGAGSVVTEDVPDHGLVWGNPARLRGFVCSCGARLVLPTGEPVWQAGLIGLYCQQCGAEVQIPAEVYRRVEEPRFGTMRGL